MLPEDPQLALRFLERAVEILEQLDKIRSRPRSERWGFGWI